MNEETTHIASAYDRDLEAIQALLMRMGGLVEAAIGEAMKALSDYDLDAAKGVREADKKIDALEQEIHEEAARIIALRAPMGNDLRAILSVMKISSNLERIGDYAKNISKRVLILSQSSPVDEGQKSLVRICRVVQSMLRDGLDCHLRRDVDLAHAVRDRDIEVDQMYNSLFREFLTHMLENPRNITGCMHLHFIAKNIERMGDHVTSITEQVIYLVTGELPDDERQKQDQTSVVSSE